MTPSTLPPDLLVDQQAIDRKRKMSDLLLGQALQPLQATKAGRFMVAPSPLQALAKAAMGYTALQDEKEADNQAANLAQTAGQRRAAALSMAMDQLSGRPARGMQEDPASNIIGPADAIAPNPTAATNMLMASGDPMLAQLGGSILSHQVQSQLPQRPQPFTLKEGETRYGADGKPIVAAPPKDDEFTRVLKLAGIDPASPEGRRLAGERAKKLSTHAPAADVKVDVKTGEGLAKEIGPMVSESRASAIGALQTAEIANRIRGAIASGNVTLGPGANIRNSINQVSQTLGVAGQSTEERLVNTRNVIRGLAQSTVAARKQLKGQGQVSDFEGKLLQKAESGEIDNMTLPELKSFMELSERLAKLQYDMHTHNVNVMRQRPDLANLVPFYEVPAWQSFNAPEAPKPETPAVPGKKNVKFGDL